MKQTKENKNKKTEISEKEKKVKWLYKYSDDLANFFGGLLVLSVGTILFILFSLHFERIQGNYQIGIFIALILILAITAYGLMIHFARKVPVVESIDETKIHEGATYIVSDWSLKTLIAAGVGEDIILFLKDLRSKENNKDLKMTLPSNNPDDWLTQLTSSLGKTRVKEYKETILKYTRREN